MAIGNNLKKLRVNKGMTQKDLADSLNVSSQAVSRWENDEVEPDISTLSKLSSIFEVPVDAIINGNFEKKEEPADKTVEVAAVAATVAAVAKTKEEPTKQEVVHKCADCHKELKETDTVHKVKRGTNEVEVCESCWQEHLKVEEQLKKIGKDPKKTKRKGASDGYRSFFERDDHTVLIWSIILGVVALAITLILMIVFREKVAVGWIIGAPLIVGFGLFADIYCMFTGTWVADVFIEISSWSIRLPGIIFSFDLDGLAFLIVMKILFAIIGFVVGVLTFLFALIFSSVCAIFTFPFVIGKGESL